MWDTSLYVAFTFTSAFFFFFYFLRVLGTFAALLKTCSYIWYDDWNEVRVWYTLLYQRLRFAAPKQACQAFGVCKLKVKVAARQAGLDSLGLFAAGRADAAETGIREN